MTKHQRKYDRKSLKASEHGRRQWGPCLPWVFIHGADKVEGGLMMLFFGLVFSVDPWKFFGRRLN